MMLLVVAIMFATVEFANAAPTDPDDRAFKFPITFENGKIGVNFLGFHAAAGLGGLLTGNAADGGLQAEAGTPFGQKAWAGLGGGLNGEGRSVGGLYAGATAGGGIGAKAGIGGQAGPGGSFGTSYAGASAGGLQRNVLKTVGQPPTYMGIRKETVVPVILENSNIQVVKKVKKIDKISNTPKVAEESGLPPPVYDLDVRANSLPPPPAPPLPQYPVYVEKTKYKLRRRPHHRKRVFITKEFIPVPLETPVVPPGEGPFVAPGAIAITKVIKPTHIVNDHSHDQIPTLNAAEELVGSFANGIGRSTTITKSLQFDGPKPVDINIENKSSDVNAEQSKSVFVKLEASKVNNDATKKL